MECDIERCLTCDPSDDWTYPTCTSCEDELHLAEVFLDHDTLYSRCEWDDSDLMIENCDFVSPIDRSVCETCFDGYIWDEIEKVCTYCSDFIQDCATCYSGVDGIKCSECSGDMDVYHEDGTCWDSHCELTASLGGPDAC